MKPDVNYFKTNVVDKQKKDNPKSHLSVLVIDDNEETTTMLSKFLKSKGLNASITNDPLEGLNLIRREKFDAILLDVMMPVVSGIGVIEILAGENILQKQNIYIFSGASLPKIQLTNLLRRDGVHGFLKKPCDLNEIYETITK